MTSSSYPPGDAGTEDDDLLADLFDTLLQDILDGRSPDLDALHADRPDLRERIHKTWALACAVAGRREPSRPSFGGYEIQRELGHGGMGTVYLARHQTLQRDVAIKVLPQSLAMSPRAKQRFLEEARALAQIRHENVVHVHRVVEHTTMLAFEMEYVDGPSLQQLILDLRQHGKAASLAAIANLLGLPPATLGARTSVEWLVRLTIRIARALAVVHRHGLVHRDVKPSNILLRNDGTPVLADFGLALPTDLDATRTRFAGTPVYAAPERLRGGDAAADARTDVYSLGVTLYEALTLTPPFAGSSTHEVLRRIEGGAAPPLRTRAPHVSRDLATVTQKAMEADPRHRYATADEFADDLERLLNLQPIHARPAGPLRRSLQFVRRHSRVVGAAVASAVLVAAAIWPLAAHAAAASAARETAAAARHAARSALLRPAALPTSWSEVVGSEQEVRQPGLREARLAAIDAALRDYDRALAARPEDRGLAAERGAVGAVRALVAGDDPTAASLPPLCAEFAAKAKNGARLGDVIGNEHLTVADEDRFAAGVFAFLIGEHAVSGACWRPLPPAAHEDQFLDACQALQAAGHNPARSYASLFHAARAFPQAQALAIALIDAALAAGDLQEARQRLARLPADADADAMLAARRRLLAADLLRAEGKPSEALIEYRALAQQRPGDPMPLLRLADGYLGVGDRDAARRVFQVVLRRWPNHGTAHLRLARMALQEHDVAGYLAQVRPLLARHQRGDNDVAADVAEVLRLGGLEHLEHHPPRGSAPRVPGHDDAIPLSAWLRPDRIDAVRRGLELTATFDAAMLRLAEHDPRPAVTAILAGVETLLQLPQGNVLPTPTRVGLTALAPWLCRAIVRQDFLRMLPFARVLDDPIFSGQAVIVYTGPAYDPKLYYGYQVQTVGDCDGDTLDELCVTAPTTDGSTPGYLEFRSLPDGALLRTWREQDANRLFARAVAVLPDVDGDACRDLVVGRPLCSREPGLRALVELRSGRTGATLWSTSDPAPSFGAALATIGDVDGDGHDDIVAGVSPMTLRERGQVLLLSGRSGAVLRRIDADAAGHWFGGAVGNAGDLDGDGRDDVVVGGNYGAAPGVVCTYDAESGRLLTTFTESKIDQTFGHAVLGVGDLDGDGRGEIAIAAPAANTNDPGRVLVFSSRTLRPLYELRGERPRDVFGAGLCRLPSWFRNGPPALAVAARRGGPAGIGYVRIFDLQSGQPLQTSTASSAAAFGVGLVDLGDRDQDGLRDLGAIVLTSHRRFQLWSQSYAQVLQGLKR